ncbi:MAG: serine/threonine protein kinase, partial [Planctomycetota bacterium]
ALAMLDHPNIARVLDAGAATGTGPYFVMELVKGVPITRYCDEKGLRTRQRLELFVQVCQAVQHAHQKGIIHRDIKPSNVLVSVHDGAPLVKIIDFGVAKAIGPRLTEQTIHTQEGQAIGTPEYMSPEQIGPGDLDIDTRSDIYALGMLLYELLTGLLPFDRTKLRRARWAEIERTILEVDAPRPSQRLGTLVRHEAGDGRLKDIARARGTDGRALVRELRGDVDWIVMKALEKDRARRYETASALALDVARHLRDETVLARPPSTGYRLTKFARRHRLGVTAGTVVAGAILVGLGLSMAGFRQAVTEREEAEAARDESEAVTDFLSDMIQESSPWHQGQDITVRQVMDQAAPKLEEQFAEQPAVRGRLHHVIGETYMTLGMNAESEQHLQAALEAYRVSVGEEHAHFANATGALGLTYYASGRLVDAERWLLRAIELQEALHEPGHPSAMLSKNNLSMVYTDQRRYEEAEALIREVLEHRRSVLPPEDRSMLSTVHNLGHILQSQKKFEEAQPLLEEVVAIRRRVLREGHPDLLVSLSVLATIYQAQNKLPEATELFEESLAGLRRELGNDHMHTMMGMNNLALVYALQERYADAGPLYAEVVENLRRIVPPGFYGLGIALNGRAACLLDAERYREAEAALLEAHPILEAALGPQNNHTRKSAALLCELYEAWERPEAAA